MDECIKSIEVYRDTRGNYEILDVFEDGTINLTVWNEEEDMQTYININSIIKALKENNLLEGD